MTRRTEATRRPRASGESSIYQDDDGRWHGFVSMGKKENGRRDRRHVSAAKRADVVAKVRALEAKRDAGMVEAAGRAPTVGEWLDHWLDNIAARKVRARTLESYRSTVRLHLRRVPPARPAAAATPRTALRRARRRGPRRPGH
jgi:integrase